MINNLLKKSLIIIISFLGFCLISYPAQANETSRLFDEANLFSDSDKTTIQSAIATFKTETKMDAVILTTIDAEGKSPQDYADDFYDQHNFGTGPNKTGFLFLIDMDNRTYYISTAGTLIELLTGSKRERLLDHAETSMKSQNYTDAVLSVIDDMSRYTKNYNYDQSSGALTKVKTITTLEGLIAVIAGIVVSLAVYSTVYGKYTLKRSSYRYSYRDNGSLSLSQRDDHLINTFTTSRHIPKVDPGNGSHTSSGGSSHGGGGRGF
ncbi:TPM domain-containing protein [Vagococcus intermedius]|uniref:TPM domain-containing protein n=1 Tax=Vagococcus intermedius TaxID=2991418 RepID=A0AAF0I5B0_9ENTE|nr:TPM domain-containing protein [Vagococcus intermedius]WEG72868.1 TPM domain-containing protein [Vagococcus intermedius]WEG74955.1 TPM domain-containing protein [Vagococcus intermedius]